MSKAILMSHSVLYATILCLFTASGAIAQRDTSALAGRVDHLVYATPDLDRGIKEIEDKLGVRAILGGRHPGRGTRNALVALGPSVYLEIIAPDPDQPAPAYPRVFGIDKLKESKLVGWAVTSTNVDSVYRRAAENRILLGDVHSGSRQRPDGVVLSWRFTSPERAIADGLVPFFIDWGQSPHPARTAPQGATLVELRAEHPDAPRIQQMLRILALDVPVSLASGAALIAVVDGRRGRVEIR